MQMDSRLVPRGQRRRMDSPIRTEDLMSDVEFLPPSAPSSAPPSPRLTSAADESRIGLSAASVAARSLPSSPHASFVATTTSSEMTARLHSSLGAAHSSSPPSSSSVGAPTSRSRETLQRGGGTDLARSGPPWQPDPVLRLTASSQTGLGHLHEVAGPGTHETTTSHRPKSVQFSDKAPGLMVPPGPMVPPGLEEPAMQAVQRLSKRAESSDGTKGGSRHISEMESVRSHLQNMLKLSQELTCSVSPSSLMSKGIDDQRDDDSFESDCTSALLSAKPYQEISVSPPIPLLGLDDAALFPRYSRMRLGTGEGLVAESSLYENQILKDTLDKERTRRKHCEKQIQSLQNKILELQQQLAVAVSADRKKDIMIEQLDKTLVKVVDGWKKHDSEKSEAMRQLQEDREAAEKGRSKQQQAMFNLEQRLSQANQTMMKEQQERGLLEEERGMLEEQNQMLQKALEVEQQLCLRLQGDYEAAESSRQHEWKQAEALRTKLAEEREASSQREKQLEQRITQQEEELQKQLEKEKATAQRETQRAQDAQQVLGAVQTELQRVEIELDTAKRDKENLEMELSLVKARSESQRVKSETEFKMALEQQVTERLAAVHEDSIRQTAAVREQLRKQIMEMATQHEVEMGKQLAEFKSELQEREERHRGIAEGYEIRLAKVQEEMGRLLTTKRKLEVQRGEMVIKLQSMMQTHWNEALKVLMSEDSPPGLQRFSQPALRHNQVPVYTELNRTTSASEAINNSDLSSSSTVPYPVPTSDTDWLKHSSESRDTHASGAQVHKNLVKLQNSTCVSQREESHFSTLAPDCKVQGDRIEGGRPSYTNREACVFVDNSTLDGHSFHGSFPQGVPLQPVVQAPSHQLASMAAKDQESDPCPNNLSRHHTLASTAAETLKPLMKGGGYPQQGPPHCGDQPPLSGNLCFSEQSQNQSMMLPLLPYHPSLEDLSQLLNYSFLSHGSFQPLEPQVDETMVTASGAHPDELAEHPFTEDADDSRLTHDQLASEGGTTKNSSFESSGGQSSSQEQNSQSSELQYYIQMLLDRSPGDPVETGAEPVKPNVVQDDVVSQQGGSQVLHDCPTLWESAKPQSTRQFPAGQNSKPSSKAVQKVKVDPSEAVPLQRALGSRSPQKSGSSGGVLSPKQIGELSRLLSMHHIASNQPAPAMEELFTYLRGIQHDSPDGSEAVAASARRNLDQKLNLVVKTEGSSVQNSQRRFLANKTATEKSSNSSKPGKKPMQNSQSGSKGVKTTVWR
ncbi:centrobin isoform X2 [Chiloscyllium plagiosum]|uniref:centrobin isoform X2 n=1 Tax=Chiloscyllium plagiosum TaxID=36176 RepID=UPI001CB81A01|nr:centrobin isoform X2 [Chiloscyllium plagiosum]